MRTRHVVFPCYLIQTADLSNRPFLMGKASAVVNDELSAKEIVDEFVNTAVAEISKGSSMVQSKSKL